MLRVKMCQQYGTIGGKLIMLFINLESLFSAGGVLVPWWNLVSLESDVVAAKLQLYCDPKADEIRVEQKVWRVRKGRDKNRKR